MRECSIVCGAPYHVWDLPSVIIRDDVATDPSDCLSLLTSAKSYFSKLRYSERYFPANIPWPLTGHRNRRRFACIFVVADFIVGHNHKLKTMFWSI